MLRLESISNTLGNQQVLGPMSAKEEKLGVSHLYKCSDTITKYITCEFTVNRTGPSPRTDTTGPRPRTELMLAGCPRQDEN